MKLAGWTALALLAALAWSLSCRRKEGMTIDLKMDLNPFKGVQTGVQGVLKGVSSQVDRVTGVASSLVPFKDTLRGLHRNWRRRNMSK